jgi:hypothetical protein
MDVKQMWKRAIADVLSYEEITQLYPEIFKDVHGPLNQLEQGCFFSPISYDTRTLQPLYQLQKKHRKELNNLKILDLALQELKSIERIFFELDWLNIGIRLYATWLKKKITQNKSYPSSILRLTDINKHELWETITPEEIIQTKAIESGLPFLQMSGEDFPQRPYRLVVSALKFRICYFSVLEIVEHFCKKYKDQSFYAKGNCK